MLQNNSNLYYHVYIDMYSNNKLWEWDLGWVANYGTLIKLSIWHQFMKFMTKYYQ